MKIGELARDTRTAVETIRFYESVGLLPPPQRSAGNYRLYGPEHGERLRFIRTCRSLDMTLDEVRTLLATRDDPARCCAQVSSLLDEHIEHVTTRIADLKTLEHMLRTLRQQCEEPIAARDCGILTTLARPAAPHEATDSHVSRSHRPVRSR